MIVGPYDHTITSPSFALIENVLNKLTRAIRHGKVREIPFDDSEIRMVEKSNKIKYAVAEFRPNT